MTNECEFSKELIEKANAFFKKPCSFIKSVLSLSELPEISLPEITFAGRSNVGKSSLINAILERNGMARTSNTPGRTQMLNYFDLGHACYLVDMPGYGYAEAPKKLVKEWQGLIKDYLRGRPTLKRAYVLIDSRHGIKENDQAMMKMLDESAVSYQVVLTKSDKISNAALIELVQTTTQLLLKHPAAHPYVHATSSEKRTGLDELRAAIFQLVHYTQTT